MRSQIQWAWPHGSAETWGSLIGCGSYGWIGREEEGRLPRRAALATANQNSGRALAGGRKAAAVQIWRESGWAFLLLVCSGVCEESLKPCARDERRSWH